MSLSRRALVKAGALAATGSAMGSHLHAMSSGAENGQAVPVKRRESADVEQWSIFEAALPGPSAGNPFVDVDSGFLPLFERGCVGFFEAVGVFVRVGAFALAHAGLAAAINALCAGIGTRWLACFVPFTPLRVRAAFSDSTSWKRWRTCFRAAA